MEQQVERLGMEEVRQRPRLVPETSPTLAPTPMLEATQRIQNPQPSTKVNHAAIIAVLQAIAVILAVRLFLLLAVIGSFILAYSGLPATDNHSLWVLGIYCVFTVLPLVWLDMKTRNRQ